ncbi:hypothetical protein ACIBEJ_35235 [Nonomuraea sp. NPDC050790]|uniref:hypothetical protein n=1 Tax=Nonomuraea sp. NPDC050790 TaxID=3364371 RepID=UPI0037A217EA
MADPQAARNLALVRIHKAAGDIRCTDPREMLRGLVRLRLLAEEIEDQLRSESWGDISRQSRAG